MNTPVALTPGTYQANHPLEITTEINTGSSATGERIEKKEEFTVVAVEQHKSTIRARVLSGGWVSLQNIKYEIDYATLISVPFEILIHH